MIQKLFNGKHVHHLVEGVLTIPKCNNGHYGMEGLTKQIKSNQNNGIKNAMRAFNLGSSKQTPILIYSCLDSFIHPLIMIHTKIICTYEGHKRTLYNFVCSQVFMPWLFHSSFHYIIFKCEGN
jgi:hypothetical protein